MKYEHLLQPMKVAGLTLKHRMLSSPTSIACYDINGNYTKEAYEYYKLRALGGAALVTVGDVIVDLSTGQSHPQQAGINEPGTAQYFRTMCDAIHSGGAAAGIEIDHGGILCNPLFIGGKQPVGPSDDTFPWGAIAHGLTEEEIYALADKYAEAAAKAKAYGYDLVMIHGGHGWMMHQFISPVTNKRTDKWGGSLENRMRFPLLVIEKVRAAVGPNYPIEIRLSGSERCEGGYGIEEGIEIAKMLDGKVDLLHISAGNQYYEASTVLMHPSSYQADMENSILAAEIKKHVKTPVVTVGAFNLPDDMEKFLAEGGADAIAMGRALIADPFLPRKVATGREDEIRTCLRCSECLSSMMNHQVIRCAVNPVIGRECEVFHPQPTYKTKKVAIIGGGPAGMEAALIAHERGHNVILFEASDHLGALDYSEEAYPKRLLLRYREAQARRIAKAGIDVRLNCTPDEADIKEVAPDAIIVATGSVPLTPPIPGVDGNNVLYAPYIRKDTEVGKNVCIIGGGFVGVEEALELEKRGCTVTLVEMAPKIAMEAGRMYRLALKSMVGESGINVLTNTTCSEITLEGVRVKDKAGAESLIPCDSVVLACGMKPREGAEKYRSMAPEVYVIAGKAGKIMNATQGAYDAVIALGYM